MDVNPLVANWSGGHLEVFSPSGGDPVARVKCPFSKPSNVHFQPGALLCTLRSTSFMGCGSLIGDAGVLYSTVRPSRHLTY